jgi:hypothetical protein
MLPVVATPIASALTNSSRTNAQVTTTDRPTNETMPARGDLPLLHIFSYAYVMFPPLVGGGGSCRVYRLDQVNLTVRSRRQALRRFLVRAASRRRARGSSQRPGQLNCWMVSRRLVAIGWTATQRACRGGKSANQRLSPLCAVVGSSELGLCRRK